MSWGYKIVLVYAFFVIGIVSMVIKSASQNVDLVTTNYYAKELHYQEKIDKVNRTNSLAENVRFIIQDNHLVITFPSFFLHKKINGTLNLYCPSDKNKDREQLFTISGNVLTVPVATANKGLHEIHLDWTADNLTYFFEQKLFIE